MFQIIFHFLHICSGKKDQRKGTKTLQFEKYSCQQKVFLFINLLKLFSQWDVLQNSWPTHQEFFILARFVINFSCITNQRILYFRILPSEEESPLATNLFIPLSGNILYETPPFLLSPHQISIVPTE